MNRNQTNNVPAVIDAINQWVINSFPGFLGPITQPAPDEAPAPSESETGVTNLEPEGVPGPADAEDNDPTAT